jgi:hypothetical protein
VSYGVLEADFAVEVGLPIDYQETGILLPAALGEFFAETGRNGGRAVGLGGDVILQRIFLCALEDGAKHFAGGEEDQGVPEVARNRFVALAALTGDGIFDGAGDIVRSFVEEDFESFGTLVARIGAGDGDAERVKGGVSAGGVGESANFNADFVLRPLGLVDVREAFGEADTLFTNKRSNAHDPAAVGAIVVRPPVSAVDGSGSFQDDSDIAGEAGVAGAILSAGEFVAILEIAQLVLQQNQINVDHEIFGGVIRNVVGDGLIPDALFVEGKSGLRAGGQFKHRPRGLDGGVVCVLDGFAGACFVIEEMVEIDPEAAVKLKDGQGTIDGVDLLWKRRGSGGGKEAEGQENENAKKGKAHIGKGNGSVLPGHGERKQLQNS